MSRNERAYRMSTDGGSASHIDRTFAAELVESIGWRDYREIISGLPAEVEQQITIMEAKAIAPDTDGVRQAAHKIAGLLSQFGAFNVSRTAELLWETESDDALRELVIELAQLSREAVAELGAITEQELRAGNR